MLDRIFWFFNRKPTKFKWSPYLSILIGSFLWGAIAMFGAFCWISVTSIEDNQVVKNTLMVFAIVISTLVVIVLGLEVWYDTKTGYVNALYQHYLKRRKEVGIKLGKISEDE